MYVRSSNRVYKRERILLVPLNVKVLSLLVQLEGYSQPGEMYSFVKSEEKK